MKQSHRSTCVLPDTIGILVSIAWQQTTVISWNINLKLLRGPCIACYLKRAHCVCDVIIAHISHGRLAVLAAIFLLALNYAYTAVGKTFIAHSYRLWRFVELQNIQMPRKVLKISWSWYSWLVTVHKDLTDLLACGVMKLL